MTRKILRYLFFVMVVVLAMSSCKVTKPYELPNMNTSNLYRDISPTDTATIATLPYIQIFTDTILQHLIAQGIGSNPDLAVAYTRIQQAEASYLQSGAAFSPTLSVNPGVTISRFSNAQGLGVRTSATTYELGFSARWEADI